MQMHIYLIMVHFIHNNQKYNNRRGCEKPEPEPTSPAGGNVKNGTGAVGYGEAFPQDINQLRDPAFPVPGRTENLDLHGNLYVNVHSSIIHVSQEVVTTQISSNWQMDK